MGLQRICRRVSQKYGIKANSKEGDKMIKLEKTDVYGWEAAIRGMRNAMNSWDKSDSDWEFVEDPSIINPNVEIKFVIGDNDLKLIKSLVKSGDDHGKVARYIEVYVDITAPFYWWKEFRTYRKGRKFMDDGDELLDPDDFEMHIETNSCSTMHKIHAKEFTLDDFSHEHLVDEFENAGTWKYCLAVVIGHLNHAREKFLKTKDKKYWYQMIQLLPSSYNQKRTVKLNYQVLKNMYRARKNHKLDEWRQFCDWIRSLPYSEIITGEVS
jgi:hypothetical protein